MFEMIQDCNCTVGVSLNESGVGLPNQGLVNNYPNFLQHVALNTGLCLGL